MSDQIGSQQMGGAARMAGYPSPKEPSLKDRVVLIADGASGLGATLVEAFTLQGAQVVFVGIADADATALVDRLALSAAHTPAYLHCDLTDSTALAACLAEMIARFGSIDVRGGSGKLNTGEGGGSRLNCPKMT